MISKVRLNEDYKSYLQMFDVTCKIVGKYERESDSVKDDEMREYLLRLVYCMEEVRLGYSRILTLIEGQLGFVKHEPRDD